MPKYDPLNLSRGPPRPLTLEEIAEEVLGRKVRLETVDPTPFVNWQGEVQDPRNFPGRFTADELLERFKAKYGYYPGLPSPKYKRVIREVRENNLPSVGANFPIPRTEVTWEEVPPTFFEKLGYNPANSAANVEAPPPKPRSIFSLMYGFTTPLPIKSKKPSFVRKKIKGKWVYINPNNSHTRKVNKKPKPPVAWRSMTRNEMLRALEQND